VGGAAVIAYTFVGGFLAVSWTDLFQGLLMFFALSLVAVIALGEIGGLGSLGAGLEAVNPFLLDPFTDSSGEVLSVIAVISLLGWGLGYVGQPHILARFMAIRSAEEIAASRMIAMSWVSIALFAGLLIGLAGIVALDTPLVGADSEKVFMVLAAGLLHPVVAGICLAGILAAVMSTADSQLLVASSAVAEDLYKGRLRPDASEKELLWVGRVAVLIIAAIALWLARNPDSKVLELVAYAWAGFGAAFGPAVVLSLYWQRMTRQGAIAGILLGGVTVIVWKQLSGGIFDLYEIVPGVLISVLAIVAVSRLTRRP
jgi:sodium/proline symporter